MAWLKNNWRLVAVGLLSLVAFALGGFATRALRRPDKTIRRELDAARAGTSAAARSVEVGAERAAVELVDQHAALVESFDDAQREKLESLRGDPAATARWLTRLSE